MGDSRAAPGIVPAYALPSESITARPISNGDEAEFNPGTVYPFGLKRRLTAQISTHIRQREPISTNKPKRKE
jgi:hypothetical protein